MHWVVPAVYDVPRPPILQIVWRSWSCTAWNYSSTWMIALYSLASTSKELTKSIGSVSGNTVLEEKDTHREKTPELALIMINFSSDSPFFCTNWSCMYAHVCTTIYSPIMLCISSLFFDLQLMSPHFIRTNVPYDSLDQVFRSHDIHVILFKLKICWLLYWECRSHSVVHMYSLLTNH